VKLQFEFLTVFRRKTGLESLAVALSGGVENRPTVLDALAALQSRPECRELKLLPEAGGRGRSCFSSDFGGRP
jgi:hypothetical protein